MSISKNISLTSNSTTTPDPQSITRSLRSNAAGVSAALRTARGRVLRAARSKKWPKHAPQRFHMLVNELHKTREEVGAEVGEFIQAPHLLFQPLRIAAAFTIPMLIPLLFMPTRILIAYAIFVVIWYLTCLLIFVTEVAMRPPWYRRGLSKKQLPPYWGSFVNDPLIDLGREFEHVSFKNLTGLTLRGWFVQPLSDVQKSENMIVFLHGAGRDRRNFLRHAQEFLKHGFSVLLFDFSDHGLSDTTIPDAPRGTLFGAREQYDCIAAVEFLKQEKGAKQVALIGTSCGASSAIQAAAIQPGLVSCIVAENPFTRADDLLRHNLDLLSKNYLSQNDHQTVRRMIFWLAGKLLLFRMGYIFQSFGAIDVVGQVDCPLLIAHSTHDDIVPF